MTLNGGFFYISSLLSKGLEKKSPSGEFDNNTVVFFGMFITRPVRLRATAAFKNP